MLGRQRSVDRRRERPDLHRSDAHNAHTICPCRGHYLARLGGPLEEFEAARRVEQICNALHRCRGRAFAEKLDDRVGITDARQPSSADDPSFGYVGRVEPTAIPPEIYSRLARAARHCENLPMFSACPS